MKREYVDTHAHLTFPEFDEDRDEVLSRAWDAGLAHIVLIGSGAGLDGNRAALSLARTDPRLFFTVGVHPHDADSMQDSWLGDLEELAADEKCVGIGEIGLDMFRLRSDPALQAHRFGQLMELAVRLDKPAMIHDREAHDETWKVIEKTGVPASGGVFHCFSGDLPFARRAVEKGFLISVPGVVTFPKAKVLKEVVAGIPLEKILIETDCPYLAPVPHRGKRNEPAYVVEVADEIARIKGVAPEDVARVTTLNARRLFGLPGAEMEPRIAYRIRNSLYLNITNRCNMACSFCPKFTDFEVKGYYLKLDNEPDVEQIFQAVGQPERFDEVVFCGYGEPTLRIEMLKVIARRMKERGAKKVRLNTDGLANLVYGRNVLPELAGLIDSMSISMNAPNGTTHESICPSRFGAAAYEAMIEFVKEAKKHIPEVAVTVVALPGLDVEACRKKANDLGVLFRVREYMNVG